MTIPTGRLLLAPTAQGLLDEVVTFYTQNGVPLPERRVILPGAPGMVAWDCEQVTVNLANIAIPGNTLGPNPQMGPPAGVGLIRRATWAVQVVRCTPRPSARGTAPSAAELTAAGLASLEDAGLLSQCFALLAGDPRGRSRPWLPVGATVNAGTVVSLGPEDYHAHEAQVVISAMEAAP